MDKKLICKTLISGLILATAASSSQAAETSTIQSNHLAPVIVQTDGEGQALMLRSLTLPISQSVFSFHFISPDLNTWPDSHEYSEGMIYGSDLSLTWFTLPLDSVNALDSDAITSSVFVFSEQEGGQNVESANDADINISHLFKNNDTLDIQIARPGDTNNDGRTEHCLNHIGGCDSYQEFGSHTPNRDLKLSMPLKGEVTLPHRVTRILPQLGNLSTDFYVVGEDHKQTGKLHNAQEKGFFDYLVIENDETTQTATISWDIPTQEGTFDNRLLFDRSGSLQWWFNIAIEINPHFDSSQTQSRVILHDSFPVADANPAKPSRAIYVSY